MKNETSINNFYLLPFSGQTKNKPLITTSFFLIYLLGVLVNSSIITAICLDIQLHKPMYLFICNLSIVDIFYTSVTVPKILHMLLSGNHFVSFSQCYSQLYFFFSVATAEEILLFIMAYDRYVAICLPLHYHRILSRRKLILITIGIWAVAFINSLVLLTTTLHMTSCHSNIINQFFCDVKALTMTTCTGTLMYYVITGIEIFLFAGVPVMCTFISYFKIFLIIFNMTSAESRSKASSTCLSHITVVSIYYGTCLVGYLIPSYSDILDIVFTTVYTTVIPTVNPFIYSLQNSNVKHALLKLLKEMPFLMRNSCLYCKW